MSKWDSLLEAVLIGKVVEALTGQGYQVHFSDHDGDGMFAYASTDGRKPRDGYALWVKLVPGNGVDVISDYTTNLEGVMKPINDFAASWM